MNRFKQAAQKLAELFSQPIVFAAVLIAAAIIISAWLHRYEISDVSRGFVILDKATGEYCIAKECYSFVDSGSKN